MAEDKKRLSEALSRERLIGRAAKIYAEFGWPVIPLHGISDGMCTCGSNGCGNQGKHPRTQHGVKDATKSPAIVKAWWNKWPIANIGFALEPGIIVLDLDGIDDLSAFKALDLDLPSTAMVKTGRGFHLYYTVDPETPLRSTVNLLPDVGFGVDVRVAGSYVVLPPSRHLGGSRYEWASPPECTAEAPEWLMGSLQDRSAGPSEPMDIGTVFRGVKEGQRNTELFRLSSRYRALDLRSEEAWVLVQEAANKCIPPLPLDEARRCLESAYRNYSAGRGEQTDEDPFRSLATIMSDPAVLEPPAIVVPRMLWGGRVTLLAGREKLGKSTLAGAAASMVSCGAEFLEGSCAEGVVLWAGLEEHIGEIAQRFNRFGANPDRIFVAERLGRNINDLRNAVLEHEPVVVVVDTLAVYVGPLVGDASSSTCWTPIMSDLTSLARDSGAAVLLLHHARKSDGTYRDSTAVGAGVDVILEMKQDNDDDLVRRLDIHSRIPVPDTSVRFCGGEFSLVAPPRPLRDRIIDFVRMHPRCSKRQVRGGVAARAEAIETEIERLIEADRLRNRGDVSRFQLEVVS